MMTNSSAMTIAPSAYILNSSGGTISTASAAGAARTWLIAALTVLLIAAFASTARAGTEPITDNGFVRDAYLSNQTEIEISQVVLAKTQSAAVKKIAKGVIKDYTQANSQLRTIAAGKRLEVPAQLESAQKTQIEQFKTLDAKQLDSRYRAQIQQHHEIAAALYDRVSKNPRSDAELRVFAFKMLPVLRKHQQAVAKLNIAPVSVASSNTNGSSVVNRNKPI